MGFDIEYFKKRNIEQKHYIFADAIYSYFTDIKSVLDYGCGEGFMIHTFLYTEGDIIVEGYEPYMNNLTPYGKSKGLISSSVPSKKYDLVICFDVLEHVTDKKVKEIIDDLIDSTNKYLLISICSAELWNLYPDKTHINFKTKNAWNRLFKDRGLKELEVPKSFLFGDHMLMYEKEVKQ